MNHRDNITKDGPAVVRNMLCEAAWQGVLKSPTIRAFVQHISGGKSDRRRKIAIVATAHYLTRVMTAMLRSGQAWRERVAEHNDRASTPTASVSRSSHAPSLT